MMTLQARKIQKFSPFLFIDVSRPADFIAARSWLPCGNEAINGPDEHQQTHLFKLVSGPEFEPFISLTY
jgi:hypothetical protein